MNNPLIAVLPFWSGDADLAVAWLEWAKFLSEQPGGDVSDHLLLIFHRSDVRPETIERIRSLDLHRPPFFRVGRIPALQEPDRQIHGHVLTWVERNLPGSATLFCNPDTCPTRPPWFNQIVREYVRADAPFMGDFVEGKLYGCVDHMPNDGSVYAANWRELAPSILRDSTDVMIAPEVLPHFYHADTLQQLWIPGPFTPANVKRIRPGTALLHQCKDGTLQALLRERILSKLEFAPHG